MARFTPENEKQAREILSRYPVARSAMIPLLHLAQAQDGYVTEDAMSHIAELCGVTSAEVLGTCTFYEMFKLEPVGRYLVNVCTNISCMLLGADDLLHHAEKRLGITVGETTSDGLFTLEGVECIAACTEAPCLQVNYRYRYKVGAEQFDGLVDQLAAGELDAEVPPHGTLARVRQHIPADRAAGPADPAVSRVPVWMRTADVDEPADGGAS